MLATCLLVSTDSVRADIYLLADAYADENSSRKDSALTDEELELPMTEESSSEPLSSDEPPPENSDQYDEEMPGEAPLGEAPMIEEYMAAQATWEWVPTGLIYHSYMAGPQEPRMGVASFQELEDERTLWDATLGGRFGLLRYGNCDPTCPVGYQLDIYGAAIARLDVDNRQDLDSTDYVFGLPLTWGDERLQFKFGYAHISSHLGDELAIRNPALLANRVNYVRDSLVFGTSYYPHPIWRAYSELGYAFHTSGGAEPIELQFGSELSKPGPTEDRWTPFTAVNARMREEYDFGGDLSLQAGVLRRGLLGQTIRFGAHFYNGKSSQFQFFDTSEQQIGIGLWYDM